MDSSEFRRGNLSHSAKLIIVSAPSGAGKTTLCDLLLRDFPQIQLSISATTRPKRPYEKEGVHYHFLTPEEFQKRVKAGAFVEHAVVHGNHYGTLKSTVEDTLKKDQPLLFDIDVQGAMSLKKLYPTQCLLLFILPPSLESLEQRLVGRGSDTGRSIETRLNNAYNELEWSKSFDHQIVNDQLEKAYAQMKEIVIKACRLSPKKASP